MLARLEFQAGHAQVWRDAVCRWSHRRSGIDDELGRVGNYPNRLEAREQALDGYEVIDVTPWEAASGSKAVQLADALGSGAVSFRFDGAAGWYDLQLQYFDENDGSAQFHVKLNDQLLDAWTAIGGSPTPTERPDSHSSIHRTISAVALRPGDVISVRGTADAGERAAIDFLEIIVSPQP